MTLNELVRATHAVHKKRGWWDRPDTSYDDLTNDQRLLLRAAKLLMIHSEISEAVEELRCGLTRMDPKIPTLPAFDVEIVDALIRLLDLAGEMNIDIDTVRAEKEAYNLLRPDHDRENRWLAGGKRF